MEPLWRWQSSPGYAGLIPPLSTIYFSPVRIIVSVLRHRDDGVALFRIFEQFILHVEDRLACPAAVNRPKYFYCHSRSSGSSFKNHLVCIRLSEPPTAQAPTTTSSILSTSLSRTWTSPWAAKLIFLPT